MMRITEGTSPFVEESLRNVIEGERALYSFAESLGTHYDLTGRMADDPYLKAEYFARAACHHLIELAELAELPTTHPSFETFVSAYIAARSVDVQQRGSRFLDVSRSFRLALDEHLQSMGIR